MKKTSWFLLSITFLGMVFISSCAKEDDTDPTTNNTDPRAKFHGNWFISENSTDNGTASYHVTISDSSDASHILFAYLYGYNKKINATVSVNNFTIANQLIQGNNVSGHGTLSNANRIDMTYYVQTTGSHYDTVTAVLTK